MAHGVRLVQIPAAEPIALQLAAGLVPVVRHLDIFRS